MDEGPFFSRIVGNPPYRLGPGANSQVYGDFHNLYAAMGSKMSLIYPAAWIDAPPHSPNSKKYSRLRGQSNLSLVDIWPNNEATSLFPGVATGNLSVTVTDRHHSGLVKTMRAGHRENFSLLANAKPLMDSKSQEIIDILMASCGEKNLATMDSLVTSSGFGVNTFVTTDTKREDYKIYIAPAADEIDVDLYLNLYGRFKKSSSYGFHFLRRDYPLLKQADIDRWKVAWVKMNGPTNWRKTIILKPGEIYSDSFIGVRFDSQEECCNFISYFQTNLYRFCLTVALTNWSAMTKTHRFAPNVGSLKNPHSGLVGFRSDWTNADLRELFPLSDGQWNHIEKVALAEKKPKI